MLKILILLQIFHKMGISSAKFCIFGRFSDKKNIFSQVKI